MKLVESLWRLARLGFFVAAGAGLALVEACGGSSKKDAGLDRLPEVREAAPADVGTDRGAPEPAAERAAETAPEPAADAGVDDRWDVPLE